MYCPRSNVPKPRCRSLLALVEIGVSLITKAKKKSKNNDQQLKRIVVLGGGTVGRAISIDLCSQYQVTVVDRESKTLEILVSNHPIRTLVADLAQKDTVRHVIVDGDLIIGALPGSLGFETLQTVIASGKNIVDISFFDADPFVLDRLAKEQRVTAVVDCGVAPGMSNIILGYHNKRMTVNSYECLVGGLPEKGSFPYWYKASFSPTDVIEQYIRPVRHMEVRKVITKPPLSDVEVIRMDPVGTLEAFNTDGLRTLLTTMNIPNMKEKTLRYPGHVDSIRVLMETGYFGKEPLDVGDVSLRPIDLTARLLFPMWKLAPGEREFTLMQISIQGQERGRSKEYVYRLFDQYDPKTDISSMARTTGYTCTAVARLVVDGIFQQKGICAPETVGVDAECFRRIMDHLRRRGVRYRKEVHVTGASSGASLGKGC